MTTFSDFIHLTKSNLVFNGCSWEQQLVNLGATISKFGTNSEIRTTGTDQSKYKIILAWNLMNQTSVVGIIPDSEKDVAMVL